jgi:sortase A
MIALAAAARPRPAPTRRFLRSLAWLLSLAGVLALLYVAFTLLTAYFYQQTADVTLSKPLVAPSLNQPPPKESALLGRISIPRLGLHIAILEGTTARTLRLGVGHIHGTALPGQSGNIGIAGHRDSFFRGLKDIRSGDLIQIQTPSAIDTYSVDWIQIVAPSDSAVLSTEPAPALTLITCYPFYFLGAAPERYVVHAHRQ